MREPLAVLASFPPFFGGVSEDTMDDFVESQLVEHRIGEFKTELPSLDEIDAFYSLAKITEPSDRPYGWSNTIVTLDGVVSIGQGNTGVKLVGLKNFPKAKTKADFRLLAAGWAYADVIIFSAASFRAEPEQQLIIPIPDLRRFRTDVLKKRNEQPDLVMVTASGWMDTKHPAWNPERRKLVATSQNGLAKVMKHLKEQLCTAADDDASATSTINAWLKAHDVEIKVFESSVSADDVDLMALAKYLKSDWKAHYIDVSAGPTLISLMVKAKVLDEYRYTTSGIVAGKKPTGGPGIELPDERPECFPASINDYPIDKSPVLEFVALRLFGPFHVYHRGKWLYRH